MVLQIRTHPTWYLFLMLAVLVPTPGSDASAAILELAGPTGAEVFLDNEAIGFMPLPGPLELNPGKYMLRCELPGHQPFEMIVRLDSEEDRRAILARLMPLRKRTALTSNLLFAGLGQHYTGKNLRGWIYNAMEAGGLLTALVGELQRSNYRKDYLLLMGEYDQQINVDRIEYYKEEALAAYADMEDSEQLRNTALFVAGGAVVLSLLDSLLFFPSFEAGMGTPAALSGTMEQVPTQARDTVYMAYRTSF